MVNSFNSTTITKQELKKFYRRTSLLPLSERIRARVAYAGIKMDSLVGNNDCYFDVNDDPVGTAGLAGTFAIMTTFPYYSVKESVVSLLRNVQIKYF